jgi:hypothetical protein
LGWIFNRSRRKAGAKTTSRGRLFGEHVDLLWAVRKGGHYVAGQQLVFRQQSGILERLEIRLVAQQPNSSRNSL